MPVSRGFSYLVLVLLFCVGASAQEFEPRNREIRFRPSTEARIVTIAADNTIVAVAKADPMPGNREMQPVNLDRTFAVVVTRTGDLFMRGVSVNDRGNGELRLLLPYSEQWDIDQVFIGGLRDSAGLPRSVAFSREQLTPTTVAKDSGITTNYMDCFTNGGNWRCDICYTCHTVLNMEFCGNPYYLGGGDC
jgi:hypothetical protein